MNFSNFVNIRSFSISCLITCAACFYIFFATIDALALEIVTPSSPNYDEERACLNKKFNLRPAVIYLCQNTDDVKQAIMMAKKMNKKVRIRSGRHSYEAFSNGDDVAIVDVGMMRDFKLSADNKTVTMGAGLVLSDIYSKLWEQKLTIPGGSCPSVGISGLSLGGGVSFAGRKMGLTCDSIIEYEMVRANGEVLNIKADNKYSDLFWACCGGGNGNFGVITSITFKTHPVDKVTIYSFNLDWNAAHNVSDAWFEVLKKAPRELMMFLRFSKNDNVQTLSTFGQYFGTPAELKEILQPLLKLTTDPSVDIQEVDYITAVNHWGKNTPIENFKATSLFLTKPLPQQALKDIERFFAMPQVANAFLVLDSYGGAISDVDPEKTAFAHRDKLASVQIMLTWEDDKDRIEQEKMIGTLRKSLGAYTDTKSAYINYPDVDINDWPHTYYGKHYKRLQEIKAKYDPDNLFTYEQGIALPLPKN